MLWQQWWKEGMKRGGLGFENRERKDEHHTHIPHYYTIYLTTDAKFLVCLAAHNWLLTARYVHCFTV